MPGLQFLLPHHAAGAASSASSDPCMSPQPAAVLQDSPFPAYSEVKAEHVVPGIRALLAELHAEVRICCLMLTYREAWCLPPDCCTSCLQHPGMTVGAFERVPVPCCVSAHAC